MQWGIGGGDLFSEEGDNMRMSQIIFLSAGINELCNEMNQKLS